MRHFLLALALALLPTLSFAQTVTDENNIVWTYGGNGDGTAYIMAGTVGSLTGPFVSGAITIPSTIIDDNTAESYTVTGIIAEQGSPGIGGHNNWSAVTSVSFPNTLTSIGDNTFSNAPLTSVTFRDNGGWPQIQHIGAWAFNSFTAETGLAIDGLDLSGLKDAVVNPCIFRNRKGVTGKLTLPVATTGIANSAFLGTGISEINFDQLTNLTTIGTWALQNTNLHGDLVLPASLTTLSHNALAYNTLLRSITFTNTTLDLPATSNTPVAADGGYQVFSGCDGLEYIDMSSCLSVTGINSADVATLSRTAGSTAAGHMFSGLPTHTFVYLPDNQAVFALTPGGIWDANAKHADIPNYALGNGAWSLNIEDGVDYFFPKPFTAREVMYVGNTNNSTTPNRTPFKLSAGETYSLYLPYAMDVTGSGIGVYEPSYYDQHKPGVTTDNTLVFSKVSTFAANTPYLARVDGSAATAPMPVIGSPDTTFPATSVPASLVGVSHNELATAVPNVNDTVGRPRVLDKNGVRWTLCGTSEAVDAATAASWGAYYFATDNTWYPVKGDAYSYGLRQHRAFFVPSVVGAAPSKGLLGGFDDTVTGVGNVTNDHATTTHVYNVSGQYVGEDINALPKGVYVVNGKKVVK